VLLILWGLTIIGMSGAVVSWTVLAYATIRVVGPSPPWYEYALNQILSPVTVLFAAFIIGFVSLSLKDLFDHVQAKPR
jgi:hypothetical protein